MVGYGAGVLFCVFSCVCVTKCSFRIFALVWSSPTIVPSVVSKGGIVWSCCRTIACLSIRWYL